MKMVRRRAVIRLEKQRKSEDRFSAIKWEVHLNLGKHNYQGYRQHFGKKPR